MEGRHIRNLIRTLTGAALCSALVTCAAVRVPEDLPAVAFQQAGLYRLETALLVFYGSLLLITPAFSGLIRGRLPIEISVRGAKFVDEADRSADLNELAFKELERTVSELEEGLDAATFNVERLEEVIKGDSTQPEVDSRQ